MIETYLNEGIKETPSEILSFLIKELEIYTNTEREQLLEVFLRSYQKQDNGAGEEYSKKQASEGYEEYLRTGVLPGYVLVTYKELKKRGTFEERAKALAPKFVEMMARIDEEGKKKP